MSPIWFPTGFDPSAHQVSPELHPDMVLTRLSERQHSVVATRQLRALKVTKGHIEGRRRSGHLRPFGVGVHLVGRQTPTFVGRRMAAVLAAGDGALLSDLSAVGALGGRSPVPRHIHVVVPPDRRVERPGLVVRRAVVHPHERTVADGVPCLTFARALLDVSAHHPRRIVEDLWHDGIYRKLLDDAAVRRLLREHIAEPGTALLRDLLADRDAAIGDVANRMEAELRQLIRNADMPEPHANYPLFIDGVRLRPDLYIPSRRLAFETDGRDGHGDPEQQLSDAKRDRLYASAGIVPVRLGWWAVHYQAPAVQAELTRFEVAWQRTGGVWTTDVPRPSFDHGRLGLSLAS